jgi:hypothetical protein
VVPSVEGVSEVGGEEPSVVLEALKESESESEPEGEGKQDGGERAESLVDGGE